MKIDWTNFTPTEFESLCATILEENGFRNIEWHGVSGGDRGRDLMAKKRVDCIGSTNVEMKWLVQCRRYTTKPPCKAEIHDWLVSCNEHKPDWCLLMVTTAISSDTRDWLKEEQNEFRFKVLVFEERDLVREIIKHRHVLSSQFPQLYSTGSSVEFYTIQNGEFEFLCGEVEEVGFHAYNCRNENDAKEKVRDFIDFLKANDPFVD